MPAMTVNGCGAAAASTSTAAPMRIGENSAKRGYCLQPKQVSSWTAWRANICCVKFIVRHAACGWGAKFLAAKILCPVWRGAVETYFRREKKKRGSVKT